MKFLQMHTYPKFPDLHSEIFIVYILVHQEFSGILVAHLFTIFAVIVQSMHFLKLSWCIIIISMGASHCSTPAAGVTSVLHGI